MRNPLFLLAAGFLLTTSIALCIGPSGFDLELIDLRWTRVALAAISGAALAMTGTVLQALMRNPLADPFVLGVSGGAAAFGSAAIIFLPFTHFFVAPLASFCGAIIASLALVYFLRQEIEGQRDRALLLGIAINAFAASFITVIKTIAPMRDTQTLLFWLIGSIGYIDATWLFILIAICAPCFALIFIRRHSLEILKLGDEEAFRLGVHVVFEKRLIYLCACILIAVSVSTCGMIAFVGLMTAHMLRPFIGSNEQVLIPASAFLGATMLVGIDAVSRLTFAFLGTELPVGALLSILGAPVFVWILCRQRAYVAD